VCHGAFKESAPGHAITGETHWRCITRAQKWKESVIVDLWDQVVGAQTCIARQIGICEKAIYATLVICAAEARNLAWSLPFIALHIKRKLYDQVVE
jgi:hypothetical protein